MMTGRSAKLMAVIVTALLIGFGSFAIKCFNEATPAGITSDTITVVCYDTITVRKPIAVDSVVVRYETNRMPIASNTEQGIKEEPGDSVDVVIPISQIEVVDSSYHIWASGYRVAVDSVQVYPRTIVQTITTTAKASKPKRWHIGPTIGYGMTHQGLQPYIGISVTYSILSF